MWERSRGEINFVFWNLFLYDVLKVRLWLVWELKLWSLDFILKLLEWLGNDFFIWLGRGLMERVIGIEYI